MRGEQKTEKSGWTCEGTVETGSSKGARSIATLETAEKEGARELIERIVCKENLNAAYKRVKRNGGAAGIDGMTVNETLAYLREHKEELIASLRESKYKPKPVRRVEIPKPGGGKRLPGVTTVIDRMIQQAIVQVLQPIFEATFSDKQLRIPAQAERASSHNESQRVLRRRVYPSSGHRFGEVFRH